MIRRLWMAAAITLLSAPVTADGPIDHKRALEARKSGEKYQAGDGNRHRCKNARAGAERKIARGSGFEGSSICGGALCAHRLNRPSMRAICFSFHLFFQ